MSSVIALLWLVFLPLAQVGALSAEASHSIAFIVCSFIGTAIMIGKKNTKPIPISIVLCTIWCLVCSLASLPFEVYSGFWIEKWQVVSVGANGFLLILAVLFGIWMWSQVSLNALPKVMFIFITANVILAGLQHYHITPFPFLSYANLPAVGVFASPSSLAAVCAMSIPVIAEERKLWMLLPSFLGLYWCHSVTALFAIGVVLVIMLIMNKRYLTAIASMILASAVCVLSSTNPIIDKLAWRIRGWEATLDVIKDKWLFGYGMAPLTWQKAVSWKYGQILPTVQSDWLFFMFSFGIVAAGLLLFALWQVFNRCKTRRKWSLVILAVMCCGQTVLYPRVLGFVVVIIAACLTVSKEKVSGKK